MRRSETAMMDLWLSFNAGLLLSAIVWTGGVESKWLSRLAPWTVFLPILTVCYLVGHILVWMVRG